MEKLLLSTPSEDEERIEVLKLKTPKNIEPTHFSTDSEDIIAEIIDEMVCEVVFEVHMELSISVADPYQYSTEIRTLDDSLLYLAEELSITKVNQDIDCPKCFVVVKCLWLSKHLAVCMNPHQSTYSYSSRNSSRIARQRIQEGFKTSYEESKNDSDDEKMKPKKRNKGRKAKIKVVRAQVK